MSFLLLLESDDELSPFSFLFFLVTSHIYIRRPLVVSVEDHPNNFAHSPRTSAAPIPITTTEERNRWIREGRKKK